MRILTAILFLLLIVSCANTEENKTIHPLDAVNTSATTNKLETINLYQLSWIEGLWIDSVSFPNTVVVENWKTIGDTIFGKRGSIKNGDTNYVQQSKIFINNNEPLYYLQGDGSPFVIFKTKEFNGNSIVFGNIANPNPTQVVYSKKGKNLHLEATSITVAGNRTFKQDFEPLKR